MMDTILSFMGSGPVGIFALLFLNNLLMYLVSKRHFNKVWSAQEERHKIVVDWAGRQEKTLRAVVHAFKDEAEGLPMPEFEDDDSVHECTYDACWITESHVH